MDGSLILGFGFFGVEEDFGGIVKDIFVPVPNNSLTKM
jgi:hypothetical protein